MHDEHDIRPRGRRARIAWWIGRSIIDGLILAVLYILIVWGWGGAWPT